MHSKLSKMKRPKCPEGVVDIATPAFFSIRPRDSLKTYYFGVPSNERSLWIGYMNDARDGMNRFREALRLKRGPVGSISNSSAALMGNLQPLAGSGTPPSAHFAVSPSNSVSSAESGSNTSSGVGPSSSRSFQSANSLQSSNSARSNTTNGSDYNRINTVEGGMMPGSSLQHHSQSAPPARQFVSSPSSPAVSSYTPRPQGSEDDPFGLLASQGPQDTPQHQQSSPSVLGASYNTSDSHSTQSPPPTAYSPQYSSSPSLYSYQQTQAQPYSSSPNPGVTTVSVLPQPVLLSVDTTVRDSFVFDSAM